MTESDQPMPAPPQADDPVTLTNDLAEDEAAEETAATIAAARFRPMPMPSGPFWLVLIAAVVGVLVILASWSVIFMFGVGIALAFVLLPIVNWLTRHGFGRTSASGIVVLVMVVIVALLLLGFFAILFNQGIPFLLAIPSYLDQIHQQIVALDLPDWIESTIADISDAVDKAVNAINPASVLLGFLQGAIGFVGTVLSLLVIPFFMFFFMRDQPKIAATFFDGIPVPWRVHIEYVIHVFKDDFADYFKAEVIVGAIMGVIIAAGTFILGSLIPGAEALREYALLLGLTAAVLELLPTIGPILSMIPALLIALTISPFAFFVVLIFYLVAFQVESSILVPLIEGKVISFGPATVLFLIALGFGLAGILGAILALPLAAIVRDVFLHFFRDAERQSLVIEEPLEGPSTV